MRVICDEMEGTIYMDVILSATDFDAIRFGEMVEAQHQTPGFHMVKKRHPKEEKVAIVMREFQDKKLHSGSKKGKIVKNPRQAVAIALSEAKRMGKKKK